MYRARLGGRAGRSSIDRPLFAPRTRLSPCPPVGGRPVHQRTGSSSRGAKAKAKTIQVKCARPRPPPQFDFGRPCLCPCLAVVGPLLIEWLIEASPDRSTDPTRRSSLVRARLGNAQHTAAVACPRAHSSALLCYLKQQHQAGRQSGRFNHRTISSHPHPNPHPHQPK